MYTVLHVYVFGYMETPSIIHRIVLRERPGATIFLIPILSTTKPLYFRKAHPSTDLHEIDLFPKTGVNSTAVSDNIEFEIIFARGSSLSITRYVPEVKMENLHRQFHHRC